MKVWQAKEGDLAQALRALSEQLSSGGGMVSKASQEKTVAVFGQPLTPIEVVRTILRDVRSRGDEAVAEYTRKLDNLSLSPARFRVPSEELKAAYEGMPKAFQESLRRAAENIARFQEFLKPCSAGLSTQSLHGGTVGIQYRPLNRVALYVPGGRAAYPSTVLMTAIPAKVAGVKEIVILSPCSSEGKMRPETLAAACAVGVTEVYRVGGAQGIGAAAYGTASIPRVDKIVGPGNLFVTLAKKEVYGEVDLDMLAGPSEVLIIADAQADPRFIAADLLSQAEHDPAAAILLTPDESVARRTLEALEEQLPKLSREKAARDCLERYGFIAVTRDLDHACDLANQFAPEHLELAVEDPKALLPRIRCAGAVFMGQYTPEPVGDYVAGPSHVLPTGGTARFFSGLSVTDFMRRMSVIEYTQEALRKAVGDIDTLARAEGLDAHARSATIRFE